MMKKKIILILIVVLLASFVTARTWTPIGDIDLKDFYAIINAINITSSAYLNDSGDLDWIGPANIFDVDDEDIESDLNTYVDIAGDTMTGRLNTTALNASTIYGDNITVTENITMQQGNSIGTSLTTERIEFLNHEIHIKDGMLRVQHTKDTGISSILENLHTGINAAISFSIWAHSNDSDPFITYWANSDASISWSHGIDASDSDKYKIHPGATLTDNSAFELDREGNLNITGNITSENVFLPAFVFAHTDVNITSLGSGFWHNITFYDEVATPKRRITHNNADDTNHTFTIIDEGFYNLDYYLSFADIAPAPNGHIVARVILNGVEVAGSLREQDTTRQNADTLIGHGNILIDLSTGDVLTVQFATDDTSIALSSHNTYGDHKDTAIVTIERVA